MIWISIKERLPEEFKNVLTFKKGCVKDAYRIDHIAYLKNRKTKFIWMNRKVNEFPKITHWCELPKIPE